MKMFPLLCLGWLLLDAGDAHAQAPPARQQAELMTRSYDESGFGKLDGHGKLVFQELYQDGYPAEWYDTYMYYPQGSRQGLKLRHNLRAMNIFLAAEIRHPGTVRAFFKEHFWHFLDNLADSSTSVVTAESITQEGVNDPFNSYLLDTDRRSPTHSARLKAKLQTYVRMDHPVMVGNNWMVDTNVITGDGAVEHWLVKGRVTPLQIDSFLCEPKEPPGTFRHRLQIFH